MRTTYRLPAALAATLLAAGGLAAATTTASAVTASGLPEVTPKAPTVVEATCEVAGSVTPTAQEGVVWEPFSRVDPTGWGNLAVTVMMARPAPGFAFPRGVRTSWEAVTSRRLEGCPGVTRSEEFIGTGTSAMKSLVRPAKASTVTGRAVTLTPLQDARLGPGSWLEVVGADPAQGEWVADGLSLTFTPAPGFTGEVTAAYRVRTQSPAPQPSVSYSLSPVDEDGNKIDDLTVTVTVAAKVVTPDPRAQAPEGYLVDAKSYISPNQMGCQVGEGYAVATALPGYVFPDGSTTMTLSQARYGQECESIRLATEHPTTSAGVPLEASTLVSGLPKGAAVAWKDTPDWGRVGEQEVGLVTTLADGTVLTSQPLTLTVTEKATSLDAVSARTDVTATAGAPLPAAQAVTGLPEGATATWSVEPDWNRTGAQTGTVTVTAGGASRDVQVSVTVTADLSAVTPRTDVATTAGRPLEAADVVSGLPEGAIATWKVEPDWTKAGTQIGTVTVTTGGASRDVQVSVTVTGAEPEPEATRSALSAPTSLARTGATVTLVALAALGLIGSGAALVTRRRP